MGRRPGLTLEQRQFALGMLGAGMRYRDVARQFNVHESTISRLKTRFEQTGSASDKPRSGRPRKTTPREDNYIVTTSRRNRFMSATVIAGRLQNSTGTRVSVGTVRNRLRKARLRACRPYVGVPLTRRHRQTRLQWARTHRRWTLQQWNHVLFSDESRFNVSFSDGRIRVWRRKGERYDQANVTQHDRYGGGSVMVWGGICHRGKTQLVTIPGTLTAARYCDEVLVPVVVPFLQEGNTNIFQQDNARPHVARQSRDVMARNNINILEWPPKSPDMSPIEHLWDVLGRQVRRRDDVNNVRDLERALHEEWQRIPIQTVRKLIRSMRKRCIAAVNAFGGHTRY